MVVIGRGKRSIDVAFATSGLVAGAPLILAALLATKLEHPHYPIFFNDVVMGRNAARFRMLKIRTMHPHQLDYANRPEIRPSDPLVTRVGTILRRFKLDELPQLINVLRGEMSIVGPRPMDPVRFEKTTPRLRERLRVRPGLTGLAQISGNTKLTWEDRMELDNWYIENWSPALDMKIMAKTIVLVILGRC